MQRVEVASRTQRVEVALRRQETKVSVLGVWAKMILFGLWGQKAKSVLAGFGGPEGGYWAQKQIVGGPCQAPGQVFGDPAWFHRVFCWACWAPACQAPIGVFSGAMRAGPPKNNVVLATQGPKISVLWWPGIDYQWALGPNDHWYSRGYGDFV